MWIATAAEQRESDVQRAVISFYAAFGCEVAKFSERRRSMITRGWPDLIVFCKQKQTIFAHECKAYRGIQSAEQSTMQRWFEECGHGYVIGGVQAAHDHFVKIGVLEP